MANVKVPLHTVLAKLTGKKAHALLNKYSGDDNVVYGPTSGGGKTINGRFKGKIVIRLSVLWSFAGYNPTAARLIFVPADMLLEVVDEGLLPDYFPAGGGQASPEMQAQYLEKKRRERHDFLLSTVMHTLTTPVTQKEPAS